MSYACVPKPEYVDMNDQNMFSLNTARIDP